MRTKQWHHGRLWTTAAVAVVVVAGSGCQEDMPQAETKGSPARAAAKVDPKAPVPAAPAAPAGDRNGSCDDGEFCYNFSSDLHGSWSDFASSTGDYGTQQPGCYEFKSPGAGQGTCIKNEAGGYWNRSTKPVTVYFNSRHAGRSVSLKPGEKGRLPDGVYNENASHRIGDTPPPPPAENPPPPAENPPPPPGGVQDMSAVLYGGGGGQVQAGFDGYTTTAGKHEGIDFAQKAGADVHSLVNGQVTAVVNGGGSLSTIAIYVPEADKTVIYLHTKPAVEQGATVTRGQRIATESNNGATAPHTHVEMRPGKQNRASKSVGDYTLDNPNPADFWKGQGYNVK